MYQGYFLHHWEEESFMIKSDTKFFQGEIFNTMEDNFVTAVDPASKEMMATKENKSDLKLPYDVDATLNDEGKTSDKKLQNEEDKVCVNNVLQYILQFYFSSLNDATGS